MTNTKPCRFCNNLDVIYIHDTDLDDSPISESAGYLVRLENVETPYIIINVNQASRDLQEKENNINSHNLDDYLMFIEAHEAVHFLEDHIDDTDENEFKADLYGTALCIIKGHRLAADIGLKRMKQRYELEESIDKLIQNAVSDLQS